MTGLSKMLTLRVIGVDVNEVVDNNGELEWIFV